MEEKRKTAVESEVPRDFWLFKYRQASLGISIEEAKGKRGLIFSPRSSSQKIAPLLLPMLKGESRLGKQTVTWPLCSLGWTLKELFRTSPEHDGRDTYGTGA